MAELTMNTAPAENAGAVVSDKPKTRKPRTAKKAEVKTVSNVIVCYNAPHNIIFEITDKNGRPQKVEINGNAVSLRGKPQGHLPVGAYGMTSIDADAWAKIQAKYGKMPAFITGRIFASETKDEAESESTARKSLRSGKEPVNVDKRGAASTAPDTSANI